MSTASASTAHSHSEISDNRSRSRRFGGERPSCTSPRFDSNRPISNGFGASSVPFTPRQEFCRFKSRRMVRAGRYPDVARSLTPGRAVPVSLFEPRRLNADDETTL